MHDLSDKSPLTPEELIEQCCALAYSLQVAELLPVKESLSFVLLEKLEVLQERMLGEVD